MEYVKPAISDLGSITDHTFGYGHNDDNGKGNGPTITFLNFDEPSHS